MPSTDISHSRVESYLTCRRKDWYGYQYPTEEGHGLRRLDSSGSLSVGTAIHRIAAVFYTTLLEGEDKEAAKVNAWSEYLAIMEEGFENRGGNYADLDEITMRFLNNERLSDEYEVLGVEMEFNLVNEDGGYPFVVDLLVRDKQGLIFVVDHKTGYNLYTSEQTDLMPQIPKYVGALRALGYKIVAGIYQIVRTQRIKGATLKKDEIVTLLTEKGIEIPPKAIVATLVEICDANGLETSAGATPEQSYQVLPVEPNLDRVMRTMMDQFDAAEEIRFRDSWDIDKQERMAFRTANTTVCKSCSFRLLCTEELRGGNVGLVLRSEYEPKPKRGGIEQSEEIDDDV